MDFLQCVRKLASKTLESLQSQVIEGCGDLRRCSKPRGGLFVSCFGLISHPLWLLVGRESIIYSTKGTWGQGVFTNQSEEGNPVVTILRDTPDDRHDD